MANEVRQISCRKCDSRSCEGCNIYTLANMLRHGEMDCLMDDHHSIVIPPEILMGKGKWISAKDDLPPQGEKVLVKTNTGGRFVIGYNHIFNRWSCGSNVAVTHWMHLPE